MVLHLLVFQTPNGKIIPVAERLAVGPQEEGSNREETRFWRLKSKVRAVYRKLQDRLDHGERVCTQLRQPEQIRVVHSPNSNRSEIEKKLRHFLEVSYSKHTRWLVINGILSLLGGVLMPLPGPNIFFFYPAARTLGHYLARSGAQRASQIELQFVCEPLVAAVEDSLAELDNVSLEIAGLEMKYNLAKLDQLLFRLSQYERRSE